MLSPSTDRAATEATLADGIDNDTAAIVLEPVQGEGGVRPLAPGTLALARELADAHGAMLVLDEVQTGVGRTGSWFAFQQAGVVPDAIGNLYIAGTLVGSADFDPEGSGDIRTATGAPPNGFAAYVTRLNVNGTAILKQL